jgi:hypothetical protein
MSDYDIGYADGRKSALAEAAEVAERGARLIDAGGEVKYVSAAKMAADLARDIADVIRSLAAQ